MRILVVEDNKKIRESLKKNLESECFAVDVAEDGEKGTQLALVNDYDVLILDNILPEKHGIDMCKEIRKAGNTTPIIILSVKQETCTKINLLNAGADDYLTKPFSFEELMARLYALLRRPQSIEDEILHIDDLSLDTKRYIVKRKSKEIKLTCKEFMLLEYLMKNQGIVLSRGMIMEHVWDMYSDPFSNTIETHMLSLRKKIKDTDKKLIHTVSGRGYKIDI